MKSLRVMLAAGALAISAAAAQAVTVAPSPVNYNGMSPTELASAIAAGAPILPTSAAPVVLPIVPGIGPVDVVPLPASSTLILLGLGALALRRRFLR